MRMHDLKKNKSFVIGNVNHLLYVEASSCHHQYAYRTRITQEDINYSAEALRYHKFQTVCRHGDGYIIHKRQELSKQLNYITDNLTSVSHGEIECHQTTNRYAHHWGVVGEVKHKRHQAERDRHWAQDKQYLTFVLALLLSNQISLIQGSRIK